MARYLLLFHAAGDGEARVEAQNAQEQEEFMGDWMMWFITASDSIVDPGAPVDLVGGKSTLSGYTILEAEDDEALDALLAGHPYLTYGTVEKHRLRHVPGPR